MKKKTLLGICVISMIIAPQWMCTIFISITTARYVLRVPGSGRVCSNTISFFFLCFFFFSRAMKMITLMLVCNAHKLNGCTCSGFDVGGLRFISFKITGKTHAARYFSKSNGILIIFDMQPANRHNLHCYYKIYSFSMFLFSFSRQLTS